MSEKYVNSKVPFKIANHFKFWLQELNTITDTEQVKKKREEKYANKFF